MAASSGAAGASIASKGMDKIKSTAGHIARRYPMAMGQRVAAFAAGKVTDDGGNFKRGFKTLGKITPFWGGRLQRGSEKIKGINAARIQSEKSEDEKNILPQARSTFERTYGAGASSKFKVSDIGFGKYRVGDKLGKLGNVPIGRIYSKIGSWGGDKEREGMMYQNMQARGEINSDNAQKATDALISTGNQDEASIIQRKFLTYQEGEAGKKEINRDIQRVGIKGLLSNLTAESANSPVATQVLSTIREHEDYKPGMIGAQIAKLDPKAKNKWKKPLVQSMEEDDDDSPLIRTNDKGEMLWDNNGQIGISFNKKQGAYADLVQVYPEEVKDMHFELEDKFNKELLTTKIADSGIDRVKAAGKFKYETADEYDARVSKFEKSIVDHKAGRIDDDTHQRNKRQASGIYTPEEIKNKKEYIAMNRGGSMTEEEADRRLNLIEGNSMVNVGAEKNDIERAAKREVAERGVKTTDSNYKTELASAIKEMTTAIRAMDEKKEISVVKNDLVNERAKAGGGDQSKIEALMRQQIILERRQGAKLRGILGNYVDDRQNKASKALLKDANDGADYSRLFEVDVHNSGGRHIIEEMAKVSSQGQQRQFLEVATPAQLKVFAEALASTGQKLNKVIVDNLTKKEKLRVAQITYVYNQMQEGASEKDAWENVHRENHEDLVKSLK